MGYLTFDVDEPLRRVWLIWCEGQEQDNSPQVVQALEVAAKDGALLCRLAVGEDFPPPSARGEPPHRRTGIGQDSILHGADATIGRAWVETDMGGDFNYMWRHERHERPWLLRTLEANRSRLQHVVAARLGE